MAVADDNVAVTLLVLLSIDAVERTERVDKSAVSVAVELLSEPSSVKEVADGRLEDDTIVTKFDPASVAEGRVALPVSVAVVGPTEAADVDVARVWAREDAGAEVAEAALPADKRLKASCTLIVVVLLGEVGSVELVFGTLYARG